jgi:glucose-6-phosphate isomerase
VILSLYHDRPESESSFARFAEASVLKSLKALDSRARRKGLDALDPSRGALIPIGMEVEGGRVTKNGYGVFDLPWQAEEHPEWPGKIAREVEEIREGIRAAHGAPGKSLPVKFLIWVGMGGSSEDKAMYQAAGLLRRGPRVYILDSTDPVKLDSIVADMKKRSGLPAKLTDADLLRRTLVIGMAMGMTSYEPVVNLEKLAAMYDAAGVDSRPNFYYMTLPGSLLDKFAARRGYRRVPLQLDEGNSTAGRHSAPMNRGSLYPLALAGVTLSAWMEGAFLSDEEVGMAWRLASFLHVQGLTQGCGGRDKVTLVLPRAWAGAGIWTKQDFEESLGKSVEYGLKIVIDERVRLKNYRAPKDPKQDRVFWCVQIKGAPGGCSEKLALLRRAGYPAASLTVPKDTTLSRYMQFVHYVVFGLAWLRKINFVTQPNVELYKSITNKLFAESERVTGGIVKTKDWRQTAETPRKSVWRGRVTLRWDRLPEKIQAEGTTAPAIYAALLKYFTCEGKCTYGELTFFGDTRYSASGRTARAVLDRAAERLFHARLKMPADVYEGPAMNHSYHEMIIGHGGCFSTIVVAESVSDDGRADYHRAQYLATQMALAEHGRAVVSLTLRDLEDSSLAALDEFFRQAATLIGQAK